MFRLSAGGFRYVIQRQHHAHNVATHLLFWLISALLCRPDTAAKAIYEGAINPLVRMLDSEDQTTLHSALLAIEALCSDIGTLRLFAHAGEIPSTSSPA